MTGKKKPKKSNAQSTLAERMEMDFKTQPSKIAAQYRSDIQKLKQLRAKLKDALKKSQTAENVAKKKLETLATTLKTKATASTKKQFNQVKKTLSTWTKQSSFLSAEYKFIEKQLNKVTEKAAQFNFISKQLAALSKQSSAFAGANQNTTSAKKENYSDTNPKTKELQTEESTETETSF